MLYFTCSPNRNKIRVKFSLRDFVENVTIETTVYCKKRSKVELSLSLSECVCVCVCKREREKEREKEGERGKGVRGVEEP